MCSCVRLSMKERERGREWKERQLQNKEYLVKREREKERGKNQRGERVVLQVSRTFEPMKVKKI